jgi:hypothetical protein
MKRGKEYFSPPKTLSLLNSLTYTRNNAMMKEKNTREKREIGKKKFSFRRSAAKRRSPKSIQITV